jgi:hypothetical protein
MTAAPALDSTHHRHAHRKRTARIYLTIIFGLLCAANSILFWFTFSAHNPWRMLLAVMFGHTLASTLLMGAIWNRQEWARYVLIALLFAVAAIFTLVLLYIGSKPELSAPRVLTLMGTGIGLIIISNTWLIRSRRIRYLATPPGSGG